MGSCCQKNKKSLKVSAIQNIKPEVTDPFLFSKPKFTIKDYSLYLKGIKEIEEIGERLIDYNVGEVQRVKTEGHSEVLVTCYQNANPSVAKEFITTISYDQEGFTIKLADKSERRDENTEDIYFPRMTSTSNGGVFQIFEWTYLHKDEEYADPRDPPELNMGKRVYEYIISFLNNS